jgi:hypothetical protein
MWAHEFYHFFFDRDKIKSPDQNFIMIDQIYDEKERLPISQTHPATQQSPSPQVVVSSELPLAPSAFPVLSTQPSKP